MRRISREEHAPVAKLVEATALEGIDAGPDDLEAALGAQHGTNAWDHPLGRPLQLGIGIGAQLQIDAPDVVGLTVQECRASRMESRVEPEAALGRKIRLHAHVGDEEAVFEHLSLEVEPESAADGAAHAVSGDQVIAAQPVASVGSLDLDFDMIGTRRHAGDAILPAEIEAAPHQRLGFGDEDFLGQDLLQIDEGGEAMPAFRQQVELVEQLLAVEHLAKIPSDTTRDHALGAAEPVEDLERTLRPANGAAAGADGIVLIQQHSRNALVHEINCGRETDGPAARHDHRVVWRTRRALVRMRAILEMRYGRRHVPILAALART